MYIFLYIMLLAQSTINFNSFAEFKQDTIQWQSYNNNIYQIAKHNNKYILLYFHSNSCIPCEKLNTITFADPFIIKLINEKFLSISINDNNKVNKQFEIKVYPTQLLLNNDGLQISKLEGFLNVEEYKKRLSIIFATQSKDQYTATLAQCELDGQPLLVIKDGGIEFNEKWKKYALNNKIRFVIVDSNDSRFDKQITKIIIIKNEGYIDEDWEQSSTNIKQIQCVGFS